MRYDLAVVGTEPAGLQLAHAAARLRLRVALLSETLTDDQTGDQGNAPIRHDLAEILQNRADLLPTVLPTMGHFSQFSRHFQDLCRTDRHTRLNLLRDLGVLVKEGSVRLESSRDLVLKDLNNRITRLSADRIVLAPASHSRSTAGIRVDGRTVLSGDQLLRIPQLPRRIAVIGAGMLGSAWADLLSRMGADVTVIEGLPAHSRSLAESFTSSANRLAPRNLRLMSGHDAIGIERGPRRGIAVILENGLRVPADIVLATHGRQVATHHLGLLPFGVILDERGRLWSNPRAASIPSISGIGQAVSSPEQDRYTPWAFDRLGNLVPAVATSEKTGRNALQAPTLQPIPARRTRTRGARRLETVSG